MDPRLRGDDKRGKMKKRTHQFGILAEKIVLWFLRCKGYEILFWRYKTYFGEIDIVAKKGKLIAFVEVKARKTVVSIEEILQPKQVDRIKKAAEFFLMKHPQFRKCDLRFDFVMVNRFFILKHFKGFW
jgi:putative endonuclease